MTIEMMTMDTAIGIATDTDHLLCRILQQQQDRGIKTNINHVVETLDMIQEVVLKITITLAPLTLSSNKHILVDITQTTDNIMTIDDISDTMMDPTNQDHTIPDLVHLDVLWIGKKLWSSKERRVLTVLCLLSMLYRGTEEERQRSTIIFVGNLPYDYREQDVATMFDRYGKLVKITIPIDSLTMKNKG